MIGKSSVRSFRWEREGRGRVCVRETRSVNHPFGHPDGRGRGTKT